MPTREQFLALVWKEVINSSLSEVWIEANVDASRRKPNEPFADVGPALERLLAAGANRRDLSLVARQARYEAVFQILYMLGDPGIDGGDANMLFEELLTADPSGMDGRPGSADI